MKPLTVKWQMHTPPCDPQKWVEMKVVAAEALPRDAALGFEGGMSSFLGYAFAKNLDRQTGWQTNNLAALQAASVYKRGVACSPSPNGYSSATASGEYNIDFFENEADFVREISDGSAFYVVDSNVKLKWPHLFRNCDHLMCVETDEFSKSLDTVGDICFASRKAKKWIAIGGGILTDIAGMAAALRNAEITFVPTTLLAMSDASVGGKTGVNYPPFGKNQVGRFYFPNRVVIHSPFLKTLDVRQLKSGAAEGIKHAILKGDKTLFTKLISAVNSPNPETEIAPLLTSIVDIKAKVVEEDPAETGVRATLNFGHTLAHALESLSHKNCPDDYLLHGEAVSVGIVFATILSTKIAKLTTEECEFIIGGIKGGGFLPSQETLSGYLGIDVSREDFSVVSQAIRGDKKSIGGESRWVTLSAIGSVYKEHEKYTVGADDLLLRESWKKLIITLD